MKKKTSTKSGFFTLRSLAALLLCFGSVSLALFAFGNLQSVTNGNEQASNSPTWLGRVAAALHLPVKSAVEEVDADNDHSPGAKFRRSMAGKSVEGAAPSAPQARGPIDQATQRKITAHQNRLGQTVYAISASGFDLSPPLSKLSKLPSMIGETGTRPENPIPAWRIPRSNKPDPVVQVAPSAGRQKNFVTPAAPSIGLNFPGMVGAGSFPPDNNGSAGNNQYVETVNSRYQVWSIDRVNNVATSLAGPSALNTLWSGFPGPSNCATRNDGDPIVLYDKLANRWLISQFTSASTGGFYYQCVAISQTADAAGAYYRYAFAVPNGNFGDYPHFGVWTDAYYMMAHGFTQASNGSGTGGIFAAMDRTKMLAGDANATWQVIIDPLESGHMPADLDGFAPPPGGAPGIFVSLHPSGMYLYRMKVDFATPANTARTLQAVMPTAPATAACGGAGGNCIPQPGGSVNALIDSLADRLMFRLAYRNFVDHESMVISHSVDPGVTGVVSGVRWYDFRISGIPDATCPSYPCTYQQGTIADVANGRNRWMPSISMDGAENILVGYSTSGKTNGMDNHSVRYTGRAKTDPLGTMTAPETTVVTGTRNIGNTGAAPGRWGDYTSTSIDPNDDCTFYHVNEFYTTGNTGNANWKTQIASARFPLGTGAGQCQDSTCTTRPASAPTIGTASPNGNNQMQVTWTAIAPAPGSYAIERATGSVGSEGLYQPVGFVPGNTTVFNDPTVQGGVTYTYRVIAATDAAGKCQALLRSGGTSGTATGSCNLKPTFAGATSASSVNGPSCGIMINWSAGTTSCPNSGTVRYNIFRGTTPDFTPSVANRIATCVPGPTSYVDSDNLISGNSYYYVVRAEDNSTGNGGECGGGNEENNSVVVAGTAYGPGAPTNGTWSDGGGDNTAFLQLNVGSTDQVWRFVKTANDAGANHTPGGAYAYRNAGPTAADKYADLTCSIAETPALTATGGGLNLTYWERHQLEKGWDGVVVEYSVNGGAWNTVPAPSNNPGDGCLATDAITDWAPLECTGSPPVNACAYPATQAAFTGPILSGTGCSGATAWVTGDPSAYARRCHSIPGVNPGDQVQFRWRFTSDPASEFAGFYLDDVGVTNIQLPAACATSTPPPLQMSSAASRQTQAGNPYDINLPLAGTPPVECRIAGGSGYTIVMTFNNALTAVDSVSTSCGSVSSSLIDVTDAHRYIVNVNGASCNVQTLTVTLNGVHSGATTLASAASSVRVLVGDTTVDGAVNSADISQTKSQSGVTVSGSNFRQDVNADGQINSADITLVKSKSGTGF